MKEPGSKVFMVLDGHPDLSGEEIGALRETVPQAVAVQMELTRVVKNPELVKGRRVISVAVFWHDDKPDGFRITIVNEEGAQLLHGMMELGYQGFLKEPVGEREKILSEKIPEQLLEAVRLQNDDSTLAHLSKEEESYFYVFGPCNVFILESEGRLDPVDDFNGIVLTYGEAEEFRA